ncbi:MAG: prevent-host-death family protein [Acidobacteria bacterium]|nr:MAG: prevent-host-death family protein [Acidobacteriota bacterium]
MDNLNTTEARENLAEILNRVAYAKDRVRITRHGKEVAAVVPIEDLERIEMMENENDVRAAGEALVEAREKGTVPWEKIKKEFGL